ncbi:acyl-CoA synthetase [Azohydromonas caseinilytica]|uniref:AMP-binding protein n=1 Tax=Azohydromonas caseinilytica TaxID=2728836 RepID=A0A848F8C6_9BURK|nr:AMP-binding protein [Azohydromonas caseinilytica]NML14965.1 AMP-binding protein [Azohydromonas caseinilytica]
MQIDPDTPRAEAEASATPDHHAALVQAWRWRVPADFNLAEACCGRWARDTPEAIAIRQVSADGSVQTCSYAQLQRDANRLSHALRRLGVARGDRVAIVLPQRIETAVAHMAVHQLGAIAMPLTTLFGPEALEFRLRHSEAVLALTDEAGIEALRSLRATVPGLHTLLAAGRAQGRGEADTVDWDAALAAAPEAFECEPTTAEDPAILIYTSGTTGAPKGALLPQRALLGNLTGFVASQNGFDLGAPWGPPALEQGTEAETATAPPAPGPFWSPADWAWTGGLMDVLLPTLFFGREVLAYRGRFDPVRAFELLQDHGVTHSFLFPTALKAMMKAVPQPRERFNLRLRGLMSAGEAVGDAVFNWCRDELGVVVNEMFGQTEVNYIVGNSATPTTPDGRPAQGWPACPGSMGRGYPGHRVAVIDDEGKVCPPGVVGDVALHRRDVHGDPDPIFFLGYWRNEEATRAKFTGDPDDSWCRTGDMAEMDAEGYLWYRGRSDDMFKAAGYRIGPGEIENCLLKHPAVANAAVVPKPDPERGAVVKAYVVLAPGYQGDAALIDELQQHVRGRLAPYEYPKDIEFIEQLPMTTTGKVQRKVLREREAARAAGSTDS